MVDNRNRANRVSMSTFTSNTIAFAVNHGAPCTCHAGVVYDAIPRDADSSSTSNTEALCILRKDAGSFGYCPYCHAFVIFS